MKYIPDYPERFTSANEARAWMERFITYYNHEHRHSGVGYHAPAGVFYGTGWVGPSKIDSIFSHWRTPLGVSRIVPTRNASLCPVVDAKEPASRCLRHP